MGVGAGKDGGDLQDSPEVPEQKQRSRALLVLFGHEHTAVVCSMLHKLPSRKLSLPNHIKHNGGHAEALALSTSSVPMQQRQTDTTYGLCVD